MGFFDFLKRISKKQKDMSFYSNVKEFEENKVEQSTEETLEEKREEYQVNNSQMA